MLGLRWGGGGGGGGGGAGGAWDGNDGPGEVDVCEGLSDRRTACKSFSPDLTFVFARRRCMVLGALPLLWSFVIVPPRCGGGDRNLVNLRCITENMRL